MVRRNKKTKSPHPPGTNGTEGGSRHVRSFLCSLAILASLEFSARVHAAELGYGGRLAESNGAPVEGPVSMSVRFYTTATGGDPVGPILEYPETQRPSDNRGKGEMTAHPWVLP
jgi:hypothetical protein